MDFLNHREGGWFSIGFSSFLLYSVLLLLNVRGCGSLKKKKSQCKAVEVTVNSKEENS